MKQQENQIVPLTNYQKLVIFLLAATQFTVILDFMIMSPLGDMLMKSLNIKPAGFGIAVSAYAFSAGISGLLTAGFADKFDRKKLLLFFYCGFIGGTVFCGMAHSYVALVTARIITGLFGGVIGSISMAIISDIFALQQRGRVMGFIQMGFGASQILGVPTGLYIANALTWEATFFMVALLATVIAVLIVLKLKPVTTHLTLQNDKNPFLHLWHTVVKRNYRIGFTATALLSIGGFMMMPFGSVFAINNLCVTSRQLPMLFMISGIASLLIMPFIGKLSDRADKFSIFTVASVWMMIMCVVYTNLTVTPLWEVILFNVLMMMGIMSRMIPSSAMTSAIPEPSDRGAFMSINSSLQQIAGGVAAAVAGMIVVQKDKFSPIEHYNIVGYLVVLVAALGIFFVYRVSRIFKQKLESGKVVRNEKLVVTEALET